MKRKSIFKWIKEHVRPHLRYHADRGEEINLKEDDIGEIVDKAEDKIEAGIKFKFKF